MNWKTALGGAAALLVLIAGLSWGTWRYLAPDVAQQASADKQQDTEAIDAARIAVTSRKPLAQSLTFKTIFVRWQGEEPAVCGQADIEEEQDSLDGDERFIYFEGALLLESEDGTATLQSRWNDICKAV